MLLASQLPSQAYSDEYSLFFLGTRRMMGAATGGKTPTGQRKFKEYVPWLWQDIRGMIETPLGVGLALR
ncbi:hypothetical protein [Acidocella sp.]|uniref:hypothetical protein n=1 Tax=Acidocella sp. TaxID=50710 RepID=UPI0017B63411|nr:hypothetical protein [Acidocella sp.]NNM55614.1 hypothetical protein [Acidocella sp.]